jgi:hypothetical protein
VHEPSRFGFSGPTSFGAGSIGNTSAFAPRPFNTFIGKNKNSRQRHPISQSTFVSTRERVSWRCSASIDLLSTLLPADDKRRLSLLTLQSQPANAFARTPPWQADNETDEDELELSGSSNQEVPDAGRCAPDCIEMLKGEGPDTMLSLDEQIQPLRVQADRPDGSQRVRCCVLASPPAVQFSWTAVHSVGAYLSSVVVSLSPLTSLSGIVATVQRQHGVWRASGEAAPCCTHL